MSIEQAIAEQTATINQLINYYNGKKDAIDSEVNSAIDRLNNAIENSDLAEAVMAASGGNMKIIYDDLGQPSFMYRVPKFNLADVGMPGTGVHPAFIVQGVEVPEIWIGAYQASIVNGRAVSLPGVTPSRWINFDNAFNACAAKGAGWHMMSNAEWSSVAALSKAMGTTPRGNTNWGRAYDATYESGRRVDNAAPGTTSGDGCTYTGSGPAPWNHNGQEFGIADLCGNVWEWQSGLRLNNGEIQIIPDNDAAAALDNSANSPYWKAIMPDGTLVSPGTAGTLKYDATSAPTNTGIQIDNVVDNPSTDETYSYQEFETMAADAGITIPDIMKQLALAPFSTHDGDQIYMRSNGERLPIRGGGWYGSAAAGLWALGLYYARSGADSNIGFRPAFVDL